MNITYKNSSILSLPTPVSLPHPPSPPPLRQSPSYIYLMKFEQSTIRRQL